MNILHHLCAHLLSKHGAKVRKDREREHIRRKTDAMRKELGLTPIKWGGR